ncbi:hypothetical protein SAMN04488540_111131 [Ferrimonas sediminum]|uniref:HTH luxR-type domain-containing protein n=1 Tax=Ferrimonas sediminum TaxID=718193 RepID=A0A1G8VQ74_9GAMM|nr:hypothetical protein [Ferrimonas sediminum]SDJ68182.1 hypothetical protein SAMN04488540_111131 [Ferrimonas sediminum]
MSRSLLDTRLRGLLKESRDRLKVRELCYCYDIANPDDWRCRLKDHHRLLKCFVKRRNLFASSEPALQLWRRKSSFIADERLNLAPLFSQTVFVWPEHQLSPRLQRQMRDLGAAALVTISIPCRLSTRFTGRFTLMVQAGEQLDNLKANLAEIEEYLSQLQMEIIMSLGKEINPLIDYNIVSPVSAYVLACLADGQDREQVSKKLSLTLRGVDYHIGVLKEVLGARTVAQMMFRAVQCGLV